jgi:GNAT superfamily N-acetyltransferase
MKVPGSFIPEVFLRTWTALSTGTFPATTIGLWKSGLLAGGFGAMVSPDLFDGRLVAHEFFWFVDQEHRTGTGAIRLLKAFEDWAVQHGAVEGRMIHLVGKNDEQLNRIYTKLGYARLEVAYVKPFASL